MLEVSKINVYYGDIQALWDVSLTVQEGEIVALIGPNGAGKSTTLSTISGLLSPKSGSIRFNSIEVNNFPSHKIVNLGISMVPEGRGIFPTMTVWENIEMGAFLSAARRVKQESAELVENIFPPLRSRRKQLAGTLSGGEQQMLAIGRALMSRPKLLLIDEFSQGLAPILVQSFVKTIEQINKSQKVSILLVEQNVHMALKLASQAYVIEAGYIVEHGGADTLLANERIVGVYLGRGARRSGKR